MANTNPGAKIFGREPALWAGLINTAVYVLGATVFHLSIKQESLAIAITAAVLGFAVALSTHDGVSAAILGLVKAVLAVGLGYGLKLDADKQAFLLSAAATLSAMFVRTQATARVPATVSTSKQPQVADQPPAPKQPQPADK